MDENTEYDEEAYDEQYPVTYLDDEAAEFEGDDGDGFADGDHDDQDDADVDREFTPSSNDVPANPPAQEPAVQQNTTDPQQSTFSRMMVGPMHLRANHPPIVPSSSRATAPDTSRPYVVESDAENDATPVPPTAPFPLTAPFTPTPAVAAPRGRGFGEHPLIEAPSSPPPPSDAGSVRSAGTAQSNGAGFFRTYHQPREPGQSARAASPGGRSADGAGTPDLVFAEIGHGRLTGVQHGVASAAAHQFAHRNAAGQGPPGAAQLMPAGMGHPMSAFAHHGVANVQVLADSSNSPYHPAQAGWPAANGRPSSSTLSMTRTSHDGSATASSAMQSASHLLPGQAASSQGVNGAGVVDDRDPADPRVRNVKRSFRSALNAAFFGRSSGEGSNGRTGGPGADLGTRGH